MLQSYGRAHLLRRLLLCWHAAFPLYRLQHARKLQRAQRRHAAWRHGRAATRIQQLVQRFLFRRVMRKFIDFSRQLKAVRKPLRKGLVGSMNKEEAKRRSAERARGVSGGGVGEIGRASCRERV